MIAYLDCSSGISGDMFLGGLIDLGVSPADIVKGLAIPVEIKTKTVKRAGIRATKAEVVTQTKKAYSLKEFKKLISESDFSPSIKDKAINIIEDLFKIEATIHEVPVERLLLHELGSPDTVVDIVGTLKAMELLGIKEFYCSPVNTGRGFINIEHGLVSVPAPATTELLRNFIIYSDGPEAELTTPTGAALLKALAKNSKIPEMRLLKTGYGAGSMDFRDWPNILRVFLGERSEKEDNLIYERDIFIVEANIDDMNPQFFEYLIELLLKNGGLDVFIENIIMKKSRPGQKISILAKEQSLENIIDIIMRETTTLGVRFYRMERQILTRRIEEFSSSLGTVRIKIAEYKGIKKLIPEYEDTKAIAENTGLPLQVVTERIRKEAMAVFNK